MKDRRYIRIFKKFTVVSPQENIGKTSKTFGGFHSDWGLGFFG